MSAVGLHHPADRDGFHRALARLLADGVRWDQVDWRVGGDPAAVAHVAIEPWPAGLPAAFTQVADAALLHHDDDRFLRVHRMAERLLDDPRAWDDVLHPEHVHLHRLQRHVRRDLHKMKAFVRFTRVDADAGEPEYVAWFEPEHFIVPAIAPFFVRRFASMRWSILTPVGSLRWDGRALSCGPAARPDEAPPPDAGQALWLTYYERIFNPARVKLDAMRKEMPVRYWKNLPEAARIPQLVAEAPVRAAAMVREAEQAARHARRASGAAAALSPLDELHVRLRRCDECEHAAHATQAVPGEGPLSARVVFVGEQPGDREDLEGRPFVGPAGELLRASLDALGVDASQVYLTNAVKHFRYEMRGKRRMHKTPGQREVAHCSQWLAHELALLRPRVVVALGRTAQNALALQGARTHDDGSITLPSGVPVRVLAHPAALLRAGESVGSDGWRRWVHQMGAALAAANDAQAET